jgi:hypothetical protein
MNFYLDEHKEIWNGQLHTLNPIGNIMKQMSSAKMIWFEALLKNVINARTPQVQEECAQLLLDSIDFMWPNALIQIYKQCRPWFERFLTKMKPYATPEQLQYLPITFLKV